MVPGISWKFWKTTWFEGSSTAVEEGRSSEAKRKLGLDILNNTEIIMTIIIFFLFLKRELDFFFKARA